MTSLAADPDGVPYDEGILVLDDGRRLAFRVWGGPADPPVVKLQGAAGCRLARGADPRQAGVRLVMFDRPGFGGSDRCPGRGLVRVADDLVQLLDHLEIDAVPVLARSAGAPHALAIAATHPDRVQALTVVSGACPVTASERAGLLRANAALGAALGRGEEAVRAYLSGLAQQLLEDGTAAVVDDEVEADSRRRQRPGVGSRDLVNRREALRQGVDGWVDETLAITGRWDFDPSDVRVRVDWWHGSLDNAVPISAVRRLVAQLPECSLHVVEGAGHLLDSANLLGPLVTRTSPR